MTEKGSYLTAAGMSLLIHVVLISLVSSISGPAVKAPLEEDPSPIEIEIIPPQLTDKGDGELQFIQKGPEPEVRQETRPEAASEVKETSSNKASEEATGSAPPALPEDTGDTPVAPPSPEAEEYTTGGNGDGQGYPEEDGGAQETGDGGGEEAGGDMGDGNAGNSAATLTGGSMPRYPRSARREGREGVVMLRVLVETDGRPASVTVRETSGYEDLDRAAIKAVKRWRFSPAMRGGEPVPGFHDVKVRFSLDETG